MGGFEGSGLSVGGSSVGGLSVPSTTKENDQILYTQIQTNDDIKAKKRMKSNTYLDNLGYCIALWMSYFQHTCPHLSL